MDSFRVSFKGGHRYQRTKWHTYYTPDIKAVVFAVSLSSYNEAVSESENMSQMEESLQVFESVAVEETFKNTPLILLLNKKDLLKMKLEAGSSMAEFYADYTGNQLPLTHPTHHHHSSI